MSTVALVPVSRSIPKVGRWRRILYAALILIALAILYLAMGAALAWNTMRPKRRTHARTPAEYSLAFSSVTFPSGDGIKLAGWYVPAARSHPRGVIILCHGIDADRQAMLGNARMLHHADFVTLLIDFRARGESGGNTCSLGYHEPEDLQAAVHWVKQRPELHGVPIGVLGASLGASTAIMAAARTPDILAVVAEAPFAQLDRAVDCHFRELLGAPAPIFSLATRWAGEIALGRRGQDISPVQEIVKIAPRPILIIEDEADSLFPAEETHMLYKAAGEPKELWTVPGAGHCGAFYTDPEEYNRRVTEFFVKNLK